MASIIHRHVTALSLSWLFLLWMYLGCLSSLAQLTSNDLTNRCGVLNQLRVLGGADSSQMISCSHPVGTLISLDWYLLSIDAPEELLSLDGVKYVDSRTSIRINHINASDEGLYMCRFNVVGSGMGQMDAGCLFVLGRARFQTCLDQSLSTSCEETIEAPPGSVTFNTRVVYTDGGSLNEIQNTRSLQFYSGSIQDGDNVLYSCGSDTQTCASTSMVTVLPGDTGKKYDISIQLQLSEAGSGVYTVFVGVLDPMTSSLSKTFNIQINNSISSPTSPTPTSPDTESPSTISSPTSPTPISPDTESPSTPSDDSTTIIAVAVAVSVSLSIIIVVSLVIIVVFIRMKRGGTTFPDGNNIQNELNNQKLTMQNVQKDPNNAQEDSNAQEEDSDAQEEDAQKRASIIEEHELSDNKASVVEV